MKFIAFAMMALLAFYGISFLSSQEDRQAILDRCPAGMSSADCFAAHDKAEADAAAKTQHEREVAAAAYEKQQEQLASTPWAELDAVGYAQKVSALVVRGNVMLWLLVFAALCALPLLWQSFQRRTY
jgi:hypothetical protein